MYSQTVTDRHIHALEKQLGRRLVRYSPSQLDEWTTRLKPAYTDDGHRTDTPLDKECQQFVSDQRLLSKFDFRYWVESYAWVIRDGAVGGGLGRTVLWESQNIALDRIAKQEEYCHECRDKGWPIPGIKLVWHKARQLGATKVARDLTCHRMTLWTYQRALAASVGDDMVKELFIRDGIILDNLPPWLKPAMGRSGKPAEYQEGQDEYRHWMTIGSIISYQTARQATDLGTGRQFEVSHLTECGLWPYPKVLTNGYIPTIPQSLMTLAMMESTAQGKRNWWCPWTESVRKGQQVGWVYIFVPWYAESKKYRLHPPDDWRPSPLTLKHYELVEQTSPEWMLGRTVRLDPEQLYWYESNRAGFAAKGDLNLWLANFCATPEESFQHTTPSIFSTEVIERLRLDTCKGTPYVVQVIPPTNRPDMVQLPTGY